MAIARNRMADGARCHARRSRREIAVERLPETFSGSDTNIHESVYGDPEALRQAMRHLPRGQREAVTLLKLREMSLKEAAAITGMSIGALKVSRSEEHTSELQSLMRISYAVFCLKKKKNIKQYKKTNK